MTTPPDLKGLTVGELLAEAQKALSVIQTALKLIDKFAPLLPAQYRAPLAELETLLSVVNGFISKL